MSFRLLTLNTEGNKHFPYQLDFLREQKADVICLQEVFAADTEIIQKTVGFQGVFLAQGQVTKENPHVPTRGEWGVMLLSRFPVQTWYTKTYVGEEEKLPIFWENPIPGDLKTSNNSMNRVLVAATLQLGSQTATVATTHFTWSPNGSSTVEQAADVAALRSSLKDLPPHVLCGDMNAPRGGATFSLLSEGYTDALPPEIVGTLDPKLHPVGHKSLAVDALLAHSSYQVKNVKMHTGVSDHCAFTADVFVQ